MSKTKAPEWAALLTLRKADTMQPRTRKLIAEWLRHQAAMLVKEGHDYAPTFRAKYWFGRGVK